MLELAKMLQLLDDFDPRPPTGLCPWTPLEDVSPPDSLPYPPSHKALLHQILVAHNIIMIIHLKQVT